MKAIRQPLSAHENRRRSRSWLRFSGPVVLFAAMGFFALSLGSEANHFRSGNLFLPLLFSALGLALFLAACALQKLWREHRTMDRAFHNTHCEFSSVFQNVLDGILITDDDGTCLDANPAAASILHISRNQLMGGNVHSLFGCGLRSENSRLILPQARQRVRAEIVPGDGPSVFVDFTVTTNYLPGRHIFVICDVTERARTETALRQSEERFHYMAENIEEIIWTMDAHSKHVVYANQAYATITGYSLDSLYANPTAYRELIHPQDRIRALSKLNELAATGLLDEEFRFIHASGAVRWIWVKAHCVAERGRKRWLVGTAQDITSRKEAEKQIAEHLDAVETARAEAEALRRSTLALSQNLAMDSVLDTLLDCLAELIPFDRATVLFVENGSELMVAREATRAEPKRAGLVLGASENVFLQRILFERKAVLLPDTAEQPEWQQSSFFDHSRAWMGIPLTAAGSVIGVLSVSSRAPTVFTTEHFRFAKSLAISAAVAIHNARVHERAEIYAAELEVRLRELRETQTALEHARTGSAGFYPRE
jgi:PAS domain S-box-containing protein